MKRYTIASLVAALLLAGAPHSGAEDGPEKEEPKAAEAEPERAERRGPGERPRQRPEGRPHPFAAADTDGDGRISREEAKAHWPGFTDERFDQLDRNNDGYLTPDEFPRRPQRGGDGRRPARPEADRDDAARPGWQRGIGRGPGASREGWMARLRAADTDGDGKLSLEEWRAAFGEDRDERFHMLDHNGDGTVVLDDLPGPGSGPGPQRPDSGRMSPEEREARFKQLIDELDRSGDGKVTWEDVQAGRPGMSREAFDRMDRNNDGVLSLEDLDRPRRGPVSR